MRNSKFIGMLTLAALAYANVANAANILFDGDGLGGSVTPGLVNQFDYGVGNGLAVGGVTAVNNWVANEADGGSRPTDFDFFFQTTLATASVQPGGPNVLNGLVGELTVVGGISEKVVFASFNPVLSQGQANFADGGGDLNYFEIYYDAAANSDMLAGTGFNDGKKILSGSIETKGTASQNQFNTDFQPAGSEPALDSFGTDNYPGLVSQSGAGNSFIDLVVTTIWSDADFFPFLEQFTTFDFLTQLKIPFTQTDPSAKFLTTTVATATGAVPVLAGAGLGVATLGAVNGGLFPGDDRAQGTDFQVQIDPNGAVAGRLVPEPSSFAVFALLAVGVLGRRRRGGNIS